MGKLLNEGPSLFIMPYLKYIKKSHLQVLKCLVSLFPSTEFKIINGRIYYWINYRKFSKMLNIEYRTLQNNINRLKGDDKNKIPFLFTYFDTTYEGKGINNRSYISLNDNLVKYVLSLKSDELMSKKTDEELKMLINLKEELCVKKKYSKQSENIVKKILTSNAYFKTRIPKNVITKTYEDACKKIDDIYYGRFAISRYYPLSEKFLHNKQFDVDGYREKIKECSNDWHKVEKLLLNASENFKLMFNNERLPYNKEYLQTNLSRWLYNSINFNEGQSQFIQCLNPPPFVKKAQSEKKADMIFDKLPPGVQIRGNELFEIMPTSTSAGTFWENISKMWNYSKVLCHYSDQFFTWLEKPSCIITEFSKFCERNDVVISNNTLNIKKAVSSNGPWLWFIEKICKKYGLSEDIAHCGSADELIDYIMAIKNEKRKN